jgi:Rhodopirellula transposase DDE domain
METPEAIAQRYAHLAGTLDERGRRALAAAEALVVGRGGISTVARATGLSRPTSALGIRELRGAVPLPPAGRVRRPGGGRKPLAAHDPPRRADLERLVEPSPRGAPESPLRWTCKSVRRLASERQGQGHAIRSQKGAELLHDLGYRLQANRKTREGTDPPDREAQCASLNTTAAAFLAAGDPVIWVDTQKTELVGDCKNGGRAWQPAGQPEAVRGHDFVVPELGRVSPSGVYDLAANAGWVSGGLDHNTAAFAVAPIRRWWERSGQQRSPPAQRLFLTADGGGSNGSRLRLWKWELQRLADQTGLTITGGHFPPGTRKWTTIEHRLFSSISQHWRGKPLVSSAVILSLIAATTTRAGLTVESELDPHPYPAGVKVTDEQMATIYLERADFHGDWNYLIRPHAV